MKNKNHFLKKLSFLLIIVSQLFLHQFESIARNNLSSENQFCLHTFQKEFSNSNIQINNDKILSEIDLAEKDFSIKPNDLFISEKGDGYNSFFDFSAEMSQEPDSNSVKTSGTESNDLNFDDLNSQSTNTEPTSALLPEKISLVESALWSKNGLFRKLGFTGELSPEQRQKEINWRRTFLTIHQTSGLITLGLMLASCYTGQMWLDGKSDSPDLHKTLVTATITGYSLTGLMALITPPPSIRRDEFSTISIHKTLAWLHLSGMVLTPILGGLIDDSKDYYKSAHFHQTSAYITTAIYTSAMLVILLFE
jgi:hypothetical protein